MSRIGKEPIAVPKEIKVKIEPGTLLVESSKGKMSLAIPLGISLENKDGFLNVSRSGDTKFLKSIHGTIRMLASNMVEGLSKGFKKELDIIGVGYKAQMKGKSLILNIGFSHPVDMPVPEGLKVTTPAPTKIIVEGADKQMVGEFAAKVRRLYPPEPYKGKGIRYTGEEVRKKLGKALAK
ncbi:MAG: 50S ribosomal protein L6 [Candidatus Omnitrophota bacterium]